MTRGRSPAGSRKAITRSLVISTVENAPCIRGITAATASSTRSDSSLAISAAMISESDVEPKSMPAALSSACSSTALIRFPLWARASSRRFPALPAARWTGWEFAQAFDPVVE
jgi:hypothetical protein